MFEGLGISGIEAQASGLHTLCSENIPDEANVTPLFQRLSLSDDERAWAEYITKLSDVDRVEFGYNRFNRDYVAANCASKLERLYFA